MITRTSAATCATCLASLKPYKPANIGHTQDQLQITCATDLLRRGVAVEVVQHLLGHASISTTVDTYSHLGIEDARRALVAAGVLAEATS